jgi:hypothetical protein
MYYDTGGNAVLEPNISEFDAGSYKLGHRHPYEAIIVTLNGKGYSLAEKDKLKDSEATKINWQAGSIVSPPFFWFTSISTREPPKRVTWRSRKGFSFAAGHSVKGGAD